VSLAFCPGLDEIYQTRRIVGRSGRVFENLGALSTVNNLAILRSLMLERRPQTTLEIGLSFGGSALTIAASHRDLKRPAARQHVAIDPFQATVWDDAGVLALERNSLIGYVEVCRQPSATALAAMVAEGRTFDLIYVDGSHLFEDVFVDAYFGFRLLSDTGILLFDDCTNTHVAKVLRFIETNWAELAAEVDLGPYRAGGASLRRRLAGRLGFVQLRAFRRTAPFSREWDAEFRDF
jgi:cephalosporin hydroxylase